MGGPSNQGVPPDVVYVVKKAGDNDELRYSLRSLRNLPHGRVWLVGYKPKWAVTEHLPTRNKLPTKYQNSTANLLTACTHDEVSDSFVYMNDDFFILRPIPEIPVLHRGPVAQVYHALERRTRHRKTSTYRDGLAATVRLLDRWGYTDPKSYELHVPVLLEKKAMVDLLRDAEPEKITALHKRTLYGNVVLGGAGTQTADVKIGNSSEVWGKDQVFVSTSNRSFKSGKVGRRLREVFDQPSEYETVEGH